MSPLAETDIDAIHDYIARENPQNARRFIGRITAEIYSLDIFPERHPLAPESKTFKEELRHVTVSTYRIVYRVLPEKVEILTVRHGAREPLWP